MTTVGASALLLCTYSISTYIQTRAQNKCIFVFILFFFLYFYFIYLFLIGFFAFCILPYSLCWLVHSCSLTVPDMLLCSLFSVAAFPSQHLVYGHIQTYTQTYTHMYVNTDVYIAEMYYFCFFRNLCCLCMDLYIQQPVSDCYWYLL